MLPRQRCQVRTWHHTPAGSGAVRTHTRQSEGPRRCDTGSSNSSSQARASTASPLQAGCNSGRHQEA
jgi:hypothetical protein